MFDVSRILDIPDHDDVPQMGLSRSGLAALVERGGIRTDGIKAKASVLKRVEVKGDRQLSQSAKDKDSLERLDQLVKLGQESGTSSLKPKADKASPKSALEQFKEAQPFMTSLMKGESVISTTSKGRNLEIKYQKKDGYNKAHVTIKNLDDPKLEPVKTAMTKDEVHSYISNLSSLKSSSSKADRKLPSLSMDTTGLSKREAKKKTGKLLRDIRNNKVAIATVQGKGKRAYTRVKGEKTLLQKRAMSDRDIARNATIKSAKLESQGQLNIFNQPKPSAAAKIAPDTAKKVKRAKEQNIPTSKMSQQSKYSVGLANIGNGFPNNPKAIEAWASKHNVSLDNLIKDYGSGLTPQAAKKNSPEFLALTKAFYNDKPFVAPKKKTPNKGIKRR